MHDSEERQLAVEAKNGSSYALAQLLERNYETVYRFMRKLTLDSHLAADVTQDCMVRAIDKIKLYDPEKSAFSTWMITIAKNLWVEKCRAGKRRREYSGYLAPGQQDPIGEILDRDEILGALKKLSAKLRIPVILRYSGGFGYEEIAGLLNIPLGTVKSRISNGLKALRKELENSER